MKTDTEISLKDDLLFKKIFSNQLVLEDLVNSFLDVMGIKERFYAVKCEPEATILPNTSYITSYGCTYVWRVYCRKCKCESRRKICKDS